MTSITKPHGELWEYEASTEWLLNRLSCLEQEQSLLQALSFRPLNQQPILKPGLKHA